MFVFLKDSTDLNWNIVSFPKFDSIFFPFRILSRSQDSPWSTHELSLSLKSPKWSKSRTKEWNNIGSNLGGFLPGIGDGEYVHPWALISSAVRRQEGGDLIDGRRWLHRHLHHVYLSAAESPPTLVAVNGQRHPSSADRPPTSSPRSCTEVAGRTATAITGQLEKISLALTIYHIYLFFTLYP